MTGRFRAETRRTCSWELLLTHWGTYTARRENVLEVIMRKGDEKKTEADREREREKKSR